MKAKIIDYDDVGYGVIKNSGKVCFVSKSLLDEEVEIKPVLEEKKYSIYKVERVIKKSPLRVESFCPYSNKCNGCNFDICTYQDGLKIKEQVLKRKFSQNKINIPNFTITPNLNSLGYRNKISLKVENYQVGFYEEKSHNFFPINKCPLAKDAINNLIKNFSLMAFSKGELTVRCNDNDELLLIINTEYKVNIKKELFTKCKIAGIVLNQKNYYLDSFLYERRKNLIYKVSYDSFFQVNQYISELIASYILEFINKDSIVLDAYCGVGFLTLKCASKAQQAVGIEIVKNAILDALNNQKINKINNVTFHLGKVENIVDKINEKFTEVIVDPPRNGLDKKTLKYLIAKEIPKIIYISCNPLTLIRDLKILKEKYEVIDIKGFDMFSYTKHVECVCILNLKKHK